MWEDSFMKGIAEELVILMGFVVGAVLFVIGVREVFRVRGTRRLWEKFLIAVSISIMAIPSLLWAQDVKQPARQQQATQDKERQEFEQRVTQITKSPEFRKLKKIWVKLNRCLDRKRRLTTSLRQWVKKVEGDFRGYGREEQQEEDEALLSKQEALEEMTYLTLRMARHIDMLYSGIMCYERTLPPPQRRDILKQLELLEKQVKEGKISRKVYKKVRRAIVQYKFQGTVVAENLNKKNMKLIFRLIRELNSPMDVLKLTPELARKIDELIEELGAKERKDRVEAVEALLEIGEVAIPKLREALKHKDPMVRVRARYILEKLTELD
jgi:hypothetical protein